MTLVDAYCLYNRARGTDLVSPEDLYNACCLFKQSNIPINLVDLRSKVKILESGIMIKQIITKRINLGRL